MLGIIPGSMAAPGFVVSGKGNAESLNSASHGAGRVMSRTQATKTFEWKKVNAFLREKGVTLVSAGLDEVPMVYKNIHEVMAAQHDLVTVLGQFDPKLVKMAPHGERPEALDVMKKESLDFRQSAAAAQFNRQSDRYGKSHILADTQDVALGLQGIDVPAGGTALDVATGGGHTALWLALARVGE